jgi:hypothetical protein
MKLNHPLNKVRPKDHMEIWRTVLPDRYSPLQANGNGIQSIYLTELSWDFAEVLSGLIGQEARSLLTATEAGLGAQAQIPLPMRRPGRGCNGLQDRCRHQAKRRNFRPIPNCGSPPNRPLTFHRGYPSKLVANDTVGILGREFDDQEPADAPAHEPGAPPRQRFSVNTRRCATLFFAHNLGMSNCQI